MLPNIPVSVWEQIAVVIVFAFLLAGLGWILVRLFTQAIADINAHYTRLIKESNQQWQQYFDARAEASSLLSQQLLERMDMVGCRLLNLSTDFEAHDRLERDVLEALYSSGQGYFRRQK